MKIFIINVSIIIKKKKLTCNIIKESINKKFHSRNSRYDLPVILTIKYVNKEKRIVFLQKLSIIIFTRLNIY